jgi:hypothetical protein
LEQLIIQWFQLTANKLTVYHSKPANMQKQLLGLAG